jgi:uncharacterized delta-60 repeat protein
MKTRTTKRRRPVLESLEGRALMTAGALDTTFGGTGMMTTSGLSYAQGVVVQPDLKTVEVGATSNHLNLMVARYNTDGSLDTTFGTGGEVTLTTNSAYLGTSIRQFSVALQSDGKIVVAGDTLVTYGYVTTKKTKTPIQRDDILVARLNPNGSLDTTFNGTGEATLDLTQGSISASGVAILSNGQIVVVGGSNGIEGAGNGFLAARFNANGTLDTTFGPNGQGYVSRSSGIAASMTLDSSGDILIGGEDINTSIGSYVGAVVRYTPAGLPDASFGNGGETLLTPPYPTNDSGRVTGIGVQSTGKVVVSGNYGKTPSGAVYAGVARLNTSGSLDTMFGSGGYFLDPNLYQPYGLTVQPDDKILVAAQTGPGLSNPDNAFVLDRVFSDGQSTDPAFGNAGMAVATFTGYTGVNPMAVVVGPDGKITVAGKVASFLGTARFLNDITTSIPLATATATSSPTAAMATSVLAPANAPTGAALAPLVLDSHDLWDAFHPLTKLRVAP